MTTFEDAKICPKCDKPGQDMGAKKSTKPGVMVHTIFCRTEFCLWKDTSWLVQVNADNTIPEPYQQIGPKSFPKLSPETETRIQEALDAQLRAETKPGAEIRNPRG